MSQPVASAQRYTRDHPCPVCGGWDTQRRGHGERCWGYVLADGTAAVCMRIQSDRELEGGWLHRLVDSPRQAGPAELVYDYRDARGQLVHQTVRRFPKRFSQRRPDGGGGWIWNLRGVETVLYRFPELLAADPAELVFLVEGEKDVDRLRAGGLVATCNPMGAGKWRPDYGESLRGRHVVILPDNDAPGRAHAEHVAHALRDQAATVRVLHLPGLGEHGDVSDWLDAAHDLSELQALIAVPAPSPPSSSRSAFVFTRLADLLAEPVETTDFLVADLLPRGGVSMIAAKPKVGKSTTARNLAYAVATGTPFLGREALSGPVLYLALEEKRAEVAAHFRRMGASDQPILIHVGAAPTSSAEGITALAAAIGEYHAVLAIADPALRLLRVRDSSDYAEMTTALEPVVELARQSGCHICIPHHAGKMERGGGDAVLGSTALFGSVDTLVEMRRHEYGRTLLSIQRYGPDLDETVVQLDEQTGLIRLGGTIDEMKISQAGEGIKKVLAEQDADGLDESAIRERVEAATSVVVRALRTLVADHTVVRSGAGKRGDPYHYRLASASPPNGAEPLENSRFLVPTIYTERENENNEHGAECDDGGLPW